MQPSLIPPSARGPVVVLYATGAGTLDPAVPDGTIVASKQLPARVVGASVTDPVPEIETLVETAAVETA
jgi:uncharacterized protein (TIGR03437 family)